MRYQPLVALALSAASVEAQGEERTTGDRGDAIAVEDNPVGVSYVATLPDTPFSPIDVEGNVKGSVLATSGADGKGVDFKVQFSNLPTEGGPFLYHLHAAPVEDGDCATTLSHLDPYLRGEDPGCDADAPQTCEVGDLSGKHGKIPTSDPFEATFNDPYATLKDGLGAFFGNRSLVLHFANKTRISCANFQLVTEDGGDYDDDVEGGSGGGEDGGNGGAVEDEDDCDDVWDGAKPDNDDDDYGKPVPPPADDEDDDADVDNGTAPPPADESGEEEEEPITTSSAVAVTGGASLLGAFAALFFAL